MIYFKNCPRLFSFLILSLAFFLLADAGRVLATPGFAGGSGTSDDPYQIATCRQLQNINEDLSAHYILNSNIDCSATAAWNENPDHPGTYFGFAPIGGALVQSCTGADEVGPFCDMADEDMMSCGMCGGTWHSSNNGVFTGSFDGNGHTIGYLYINRPEADYVALFGDADGTSGEIKNVGLVEADITGGSNTGSLIGYVFKGTISNCHAAGTVTGDESVGGLIGDANGAGSVTSCHFSGIVTGSDSNIGGLIGFSIGPNISESYSSGSVSGVSDVGGLIGIVQYAVTSCYSTSNVYGTGSVAGGLVGYVNGSADISSSYALGDVSGNDNVGGLAAYMFGGSITKSYSSGTVTGNSHSGGLIGRIPSGSVTVANSFYNSETSNGAGSGAGTAKTTAEMKTESAYTGAGWNFDETWNMDDDGNNGYPFLLWQTFNTHALIYFAASNGTINGTSTQEIVDGEDGDPVEAVADEGYHFVNWSDESTSNPRHDTEVTIDISVSASFAENEESGLDCSLPHASSYDDECNATACDSSAYIISNGACVLGTCRSVAHAATYNAYPACGAATCASGYRLSGTSCAARSSGGMSGGFMPTASSQSNTRNAASQLQSQIASLTRQIAALQQQAAELGGALGTGNSGASGKFVFTRDLATGDINGDVKYLQQFLNAHGFKLTDSGPGSPNNETTRFGKLTRFALVKYQIAGNITPASGRLGPLTRQSINSVP